MIRGSLTVARKELLTYFMTPVAYVLLFIVSFLTGFWFYSIISTLKDNITELPNLVFSINGPNYWVVAVLMTPSITMRLLSEEKRAGTLESLMTAPVTETAVMLGKYFAALVMYFALWTPTLLYLLLVIWMGGRFDTGLFAAGFLCVMVSGALFIAIGLFASSIASNQIIAAAIAIIANFVFLLGPLLARGIPIEWLRSLFIKINFLGMIGDSMEVGIVDTSYLIYALSLAAIFLFFTVRAMESRKWK